MKEQFNVCTDINECLSQLTSKKHKTAVAVSRKRIEKSQLFLSNEIHCFGKTENIQNYSISLNVRTDFENMTEMNEIIRHASEAGFIQKWETDEHTVKPYDGLNDYNPNSSPLLSDTIIFVIVLGFVALVMAVEIVVNNRMEALNRHNLLIFVHKLFYN